MTCGIQRNYLDLFLDLPWNKFSKPHSEPLFNPNPEVLSMTKKDWEEITEETFKTVFKNSAVKRTKFEGLKRNINFIK